MDINIHVLNDVYKNAKMGAEGVSRLIPKAKDDTLSGMLTSQLGGYQSFVRQARKELEKRHSQPHDVAPASRFAVIAGITKNTIKDASSENIARMIIEGSNKGIIEMTQTMNDAPGCDPTTSTLANDLISFEQRNIDRYKTIL